MTEKEYKQKDTADTIEYNKLLILENQKIIESHQIQTNIEQYAELFESTCQFSDFFLTKIKKDGLPKIKSEKIVIEEKAASEEEAETTVSEKDEEIK